MLKYKCPKCGAIGDDILYQCCQSNRVYVTHNLRTDTWTYDCTDTEGIQYAACSICKSDVGDDLDEYIIDVDDDLNEKK